MRCFQKPTTSRRWPKSKPCTNKRIRAVKNPSGKKNHAISNIGVGRAGQTVQVDFTMAKFTSGYNTILGRATLHTLQGVTSTYHQCLKFCTGSGVCCVKGSQQTTQSCYIILAYSLDSARQARKKRVEEVMANMIPKNLLKIDCKAEPTSKN